MAPTNRQSSLKAQAEETLKTNPTALGDPVSLKAETSDTEVGDGDSLYKQETKTQNSNTTGSGEGRNGKGGEGKGEGQAGKKSLKELAKENPTMLGDPVSLKAETSDLVPTEGEMGAKGDGGKKRDSNISDVAPAPTEGDIETKGGRKRDSKI